MSLTLPCFGVFQSKTIEECWRDLCTDAGRVEAEGVVCVRLRILTLNNDRRREGDADFRLLLCWLRLLVAEDLEVVARTRLSNKDLLNNTYSRLKSGKWGLPSHSRVHG